MFVSPYETLWYFILYFSCHSCDVIWYCWNVHGIMWLCLDDCVGVFVYATIQIVRTTCEYMYVCRYIYPCVGEDKVRYTNINVTTKHRYICTYVRMYVCIFVCIYTCEFFFICSVSFRIYNKQYPYPALPYSIYLHIQFFLQRI